MSHARLEHLNVTVSNPDKTAKFLGDVLGWHIRWQGGSIHNGRTIHVGNAETYLAIYQKPGAQAANLGDETYGTIGGLNHVGIVVDDLDEAETKVIAAGYTPRSHADYEPGRRFYFDDEDGIEFEFVQYD